MADFATELEQLIRKHLGSPQWHEDYQAVYNALADASERITREADKFPAKEDAEGDEPSP